MLPLRRERAAADAAALLRHFGSLRATLLAPRAELLRACDGNTELAAQLVLIRQAMRAVLRQGVESRPVIKHYRDLQDYLRLAQGNETTERLRILYLDSGNRLLREEVPQRGTIDECACYVREIIRRALELGAAGLILVHNHPSDIAAPSRGDKVLTSEIAAAARTLGIGVLDHLIVTRSEVFSFRAEGLL
ncbi:MAG TPA: DNA repair protein RadC [Sphingomonas sp.]|nr:DNA repair protein RadC [Sphingomonas sp.]